MARQASTATTARPGLVSPATPGQLAIGDGASLVRTFTQKDVELFETMSDAVEPAQADPGCASTDAVPGSVASAMWGARLIARLIATLLGTRLPGPGTVYLSQTLRFHLPIRMGDRITTRVTVQERLGEPDRVALACRSVNQSGDEVISGLAEIQVPPRAPRRDTTARSGIRPDRHRWFDELLARAIGNSVPTVAMAYPCDELSLGAAVTIAGLGLARPILVGPATRMQAMARHAGLDIGSCRVVDAPDAAAAAASAVALVRAGEATLLMKGSLETDAFMHAVVSHDTGLATGARLSHVFVMDVPTYPKPILITDAAVNVVPDLQAKRAIVQNAIDLAHVLGIATPRVAILCAVETVHPDMPSTLDAAALCKMADRGQITGGLVDGPLAFDNAVSPAAAAGKGIRSPVAGRADILVVPDLEAGNMLAKELSFMAGARSAGVVVGGRVPIILTSRADAPSAHVASCAVAVLMERARRPSSPGTEQG